MRTEYMPLMDKIIDEAEQLAENKVLRDNPYDMEIVASISEIVQLPLNDNSTGARLAIAAYRRVENARTNVDMIWTV